MAVTFYRVNGNAIMAPATPKSATHVKGWIMTTAKGSTDRQARPIGTDERSPAEPVAEYRQPGGGDTDKPPPEQPASPRD